MTERTIKAWDGNSLRVPWRVGRKVHRTIYASPFPDRPSDHDPLIGMMDTPELAEYAVRAHNEEVERRELKRDNSVLRTERDAAIASATMELRMAVRRARDHVWVMHGVASDRDLPDYIVADLSQLGHELSDALDEGEGVDDGAF